jgi:hypothetical protein
MNNTLTWFSGIFACQTTRTDAGTVYWQVSAPGMVTRSGYAANAKLALREINAAKARMMSKRATDTAAGADAPARVKRVNRRHGTDWRGD